MSITITDNAALQIAKQLQKRGLGIGLRLGVKKAGCSGLAYVINYADALENDDHVFEDHGIKVLIKAGDLPVLDGVQIDYTREGISEAFRFNNPRARATCGCGESFTV